MATITLSRTIHAPVEHVFDTIAHIEQFAEVIPHIVDVEYLTEQRRGAGTRFKETRSMRGREASNELEVTEYVENDRVRFVSDSAGTEWDTVFTVEPTDGATLLSMIMEARPHTFLAKLITPVMKGFVAKEIAKDLDLVKVHCETTS